MLTVCVEAREPQDFNMYCVTYFLALSFPLNLIVFCLHHMYYIVYPHLDCISLFNFISSYMLYIMITISGLSSEPLARPFLSSYSTAQRTTCRTYIAQQSALG